MEENRGYRRDRSPHGDRSGSRGRDEEEYDTYSRRYDDSQSRYSRAGRDSRPEDSKSYGGRQGRGTYDRRDESEYYDERSERRSYPRDDDRRSYDRSEGGRDYERSPDDRNRPEDRGFSRSPGRDFRRSLDDRRSPRGSDNRGFSSREDRDLRRSNARGLGYSRDDRRDVRDLGQHRENDRDFRRDDLGSRSPREESEEEKDYYRQNDFKEERKQDPSHEEPEEGKEEQKGEEEKREELKDMEEVEREPLIEKSMVVYSRERSYFMPHRERAILEQQIIELPPKNELIMDKEKQEAGATKDFLRKLENDGVYKIGAVTEDMCTKTLTKPIDLSLRQVYRTKVKSAIL